MDEETKKGLIDALKEDNDLTVVVLSKEDYTTLKAMIKDREAFGRVWTWFLYLAGSVATIVGGWTVFSNYWNK